MDDVLIVGVSISGTILLSWLMVCGYRHLQRRAAVEQFRDSLGIVVRSLREGHSFPCVLTILADLGPRPLAREFRLLQTRHEQGAMLPPLLRELTQRFPCFEAEYLARALESYPDEPEKVARELVRLERLRQNRNSAKKRVALACSFSRKWIRTFLLTGPFAAGGFVLLRPDAVLDVRSKLASSPVSWSLLAGLLVCGIWFVLLLQRQDEAEIVLD